MQEESMDNGQPALDMVNFVSENKEKVATWIGMGYIDFRNFMAGNLIEMTPQEAKDHLEILSAAMNVVDD